MTISTGQNHEESRVLTDSNPTPNTAEMPILCFRAMLSLLMIHKGSSNVKRSEIALKEEIGVYIEALSRYGRIHELGVGNALSDCQDEYEGEKEDIQPDEGMKSEPYQVLARHDEDTFHLE